MLFRHPIRASSDKRGLFSCDLGRNAAVEQAIQKLSNTKITHPAACGATF